MQIKRLKGYDVSTQVGYGYDEIFVTNVEGISQENKNNLPEYKLKLHNVAGENLIILSPNREAPEGCFYHASGCFGYTTDSRFGEQIKRIIGQSFHGAVHIHDQARGY